MRFEYQEAFSSIIRFEFPILLVEYNPSGWNLLRLPFFLAVFLSISI